MGRAPCCDKTKVKKGSWSPEEDAILKSYIDKHGTSGNWISLPQKIGLKRCGKSCRLRWLNYLRPNIKHGGFSEEEDNIICSLYINIGSRWSIIAAQLPGRTDNDIKNYWNTKLKKKLLGKQLKAQQAHNRRAAATLKQDINKSSTTSTTSYIPLEGFVNQANPHLGSELHPMMSYQTTHDEAQVIDDEVSIKNMGIKFGGRFCDTTSSMHPHIDQFYENYSIDHMLVNPSSSASMLHGFDQQCDLEGELREFVYCNSQLGHQQYEGLPCFYQMESLSNNNNGSNGGAASTSGVSEISWGDINCMVSDYENRRNRVLQPSDSAFAESNNWRTHEVSNGGSSHGDF